MISVVPIATLVLVILDNCFSSTAFIPSPFFAWSLNSLELPFRFVLTHKDITRNAILEVAADILKQHKRLVTSNRYRNYRNDERRLIQTFHGSRQLGRVKQFRSAIGAITRANIRVDLSRSAFNAAAHFDSEEFREGQERLIEKRESIVSLVGSSNLHAARRECGEMLHTLQDFYSHSNWVENGNLHTYNLLGQPGTEISPVASKSMPTCIDCKEKPALFSRKYGRAYAKAYFCENNILGYLKDHGFLTSGYLINSGFNKSPLPARLYGKCSHGGFSNERIGRICRGGINKDSPFKLWSPHYYYFERAAELAQQATLEILQQIRIDINNDELFGNFLGISLKTNSKVVDDRDFDEGRSREVSDEDSIISFSSLILFGFVNHSIPIDSSVVRAKIAITGNEIKVVVFSPRGVAAIKMSRYFVSSFSSTAYTAYIEVGPGLQGDWLAAVKSNGQYSIKVTADRKDLIMERLYQFSSSNVYGLSSVDGNVLLEGREVVAELELPTRELILLSCHILDQNGTLIKTIAQISQTGDGIYASQFVPPSQPFRLQLEGNDSSGFKFSHIISSLLQVSSVYVSLGDNGKHSNAVSGGMTDLTLLLHNVGSNDDEFSVSLSYNTVDQEARFGGRAPIKCNLSVSTMSLEPNSSGAFSMYCQVSNEVHEEMTLGLRVNTESLVNSNNYNSFDLDVVISVAQAESFNLQLLSSGKVSVSRKSLLSVVIIIIFLVHMISV